MINNVWFKQTIAESLKKEIHNFSPFLSDIKVFNATQSFNKTCLSSTIQNSNLIGLNEVENCVLGQNSSEYEEGIPYITGNTLWAIYQFTVVIVLLSILRARMVNTYHRIFKEADVQWKFFRYYEYLCIKYRFNAENRRTVKQLLIIALASELGK